MILWDTIPLSSWFACFTQINSLFLAPIPCLLIYWSFVQQSVKAWIQYNSKILENFWKRNLLLKAMAPHSSTHAWKIPWIEEPGRLQSMGSGRVGHHWVTSLSLLTFMHWRRKWQPTPVFLPGESQGWGSLEGCHLWGLTKSDMTEAT